MRDTIRPLTLAGAALLAAACARSPRAAGDAPDPPARTTTAVTSTTTTTTATAVPPSATDAADRLARSTRHGEWAMIKVGANDSVRAWVVYPERRDKAPVVIVIHEIFGLSTWVRAMADQVAADGFIAIAPDLLTGKGVQMAADTVVSASASSIIRTLDPAEVQRRIGAVAEYGMSLPAATRRYGITGFCWGGSTTFAHVASGGVAGLGAAVPFYGGVSPEVRAQLAVRAKVPVLGQFAGDDARVNSTIPAADSALQQAGVRFEKDFYAGAGHGFVRQQDGRDGANLEAVRRAWPKTIGWFRQHLEGR